MIETDIITESIRAGRIAHCQATDDTGSVFADDYSNPLSAIVRLGLRGQRMEYGVYDDEARGPVLPLIALLDIHHPAAILIEKNAGLRLNVVGLQRMLAGFARAKASTPSIRHISSRNARG